MARKATWSNSDGLVVGFGTNKPDNQTGGVVKTEGHLKEARMYIDYTTATTVSPYGIVLPAESLLVSCWVEVGTAWATSDAGKIEVGYIGGDVDALVDDLDEQAGTGGTANSKFYADGPDLVSTTAQLHPVSLASETRIGITKANNFTAGTATIVVQYI